VLEKWIWYPDTPASVPAGARISAGKSGSVLMSLPTRAEVSVNWVPASCMPSPLSPAKRTVTEGSAWTGLAPALAPPPACVEPGPPAPPAPPAIDPLVSCCPDRSVVSSITAQVYHRILGRESRRGASCSPPAPAQLQTQSAIQKRTYAPSLAG
jgi:hypothetical protein